MKNRELLRPSATKIVLAMAFAAISMFVVGYFVGKGLYYLFG